jgi:hypothetical protein
MSRKETFTDNFKFYENEDPSLPQIIFQCSAIESHQDKHKSLFYWGGFQSFSLSAIGYALYYGHYSGSSLLALIGLNTAGMVWLVNQ